MTTHEDCDHTCQAKLIERTIEDAWQGQYPGEAWADAENITKALDSRRICGVVLPNATPNGLPVACAFKPDHLHIVAHSWADLPTYTIRVGGSHD